MSTKSRLWSMLVVAGWIGASMAHPAPKAATFKEEVNAGTEEIFVFRTTRTQRTAGPTPACESAPFPSANEDSYDLWSLKLRTSDARLAATHEIAVGKFTACFGQGVPGQPLPMYATGTLARIPWIGTGECNPLKAQPPVHTVIAFNCTLNLSGLPEGYTGGFLVSSTLAPFLGKGADPTAHVPGYLSTSVVTVRLWRKPPG